MPKKKPNLQPLKFNNNMLLNGLKTVRQDYKIMAETWLGSGNVSC